MDILNRCPSSVWRCKHSCNSLLFGFLLGWIRSTIRENCWSLLHGCIVFNWMLLWLWSTVNKKKRNWKTLDNIFVFTFFYCMTMLCTGIYLVDHCDSWNSHNSQNTMWPADFQYVQICWKIRYHLFMACGICIFLPGEVPLDKLFSLS